MKRREDYERAGLPKVIHESVLVNLVPAKKMGVIRCSEKDEDCPTHMGIVLSVPHYADVVFEVTDAAEADRIIAAMIATRNNLWPQA